MSNHNATINADTVTVTIPEGYSVRQIVRCWPSTASTARIRCSARRSAGFDYSFLDSGKSGIAKLEGYLFPDTYEFFVNEARLTPSAACSTTSRSAWTMS